MSNLIPWKIFQQYINGNSVEEIAKENQCSVDSINEAICRAKQEA